nr:hypothetical protein [Sphingomonas sp. CDS-1]
MHTRDQLRLDQFNVTLNGEPAEHFLRWTSHDRLGVIVDRPLGALGASLLIQLATAEFFAVDHGTRRTRPLYADNYLFHIGGRWGDFSTFDFAPPRREIFLPANPATVLEAVNDRGITHLLIPDGPARPATFPFKERDAAGDRIKMCWAYSVDGTAQDSDLLITTSAPEALQNAATAAIDMRPLLSLEPASELLTEEGFEDNFEQWKSSVRNRLNEISEIERRPAAERMQAAVARSYLKEEYRSCSLDWAFDRLGGYTLEAAPA